MEAIERRQKIFRDELIRDIPVLKGQIEKSEHTAIRNFAHKYKMRLTYFDKLDALESCRRIISCHEENDLDGLLKNANELTGLLAGILNQLNNESTDS